MATVTVLHCPPLPLGIVLPCLASHQFSEEEVPEAPTSRGYPDFSGFLMSVTHC